MAIAGASGARIATIERRVRIETVDLIEIDRFDTETFEAGFTRLLNVFPRQALCVWSFAHRKTNLGGDDDLFELGHLTQVLSGDLFRNAE